MICRGHGPIRSGRFRCWTEQLPERNFEIAVAAHGVG